MLILESETHARERGAKIYCRLDSWISGRGGQNADMASVIEKSWLGAADRAGTACGEIGLISVSAGGSNRSHETAESEALSRVLGRSEATRIFAPRSLVGEGEAWTSALQVALAAHSLGVNRRGHAGGGGLYYPASDR